jgi:hypothetical protein
MKNILFLFVLIGCFKLLAQDYTINIIFDDNEFSQRNDTQVDEIGEYFFIPQKQCYNKPVYDFYIDTNNNLQRGIIADTSYPTSVSHTFVVNGKNSTPTKVEKPKFGRPKNTMTSKEIAQSEYSQTDTILKNAKNIYLLITDEINPEYYLKYKVSKYY